MDSYSVSECKWVVFILLSIYYTFIDAFFLYNLCSGFLVMELCYT